MALQNKWYLRTVAENSGKPCWIDYKTTTSVLITPDNKDFFYICKGHLKDKSFCTPSAAPPAPVEDAEAAAKKKREAELQAEIESLKKEYAAKQKKDKDKSKDEAKDAEKDKAADGKSDEKASDGKSKVGADAGAGASVADDLPRIYSLHRNFYQMRLDRIRNAEQARRNRERMKDPNFFPSVPSSGTPDA